MLPELIKFFNCVAVRPGAKLFNPEMVNMLAARRGYLVHPDACTEDVLRFIELEKANFNTTFYESWDQVNSLEEAEMKVLQLVHYLSTYGTNYQERAFTMNDFPEEMRFTEFKVLMPCTERELFDRIMGMLESGIALAAETLNLIVRQAVRYKNEYEWQIDSDKIRNREAKAVLYIVEDIIPSDPIEFMRVVMYLAKGNALIINDENTFNTIKENIKRIASVFMNLDRKHLESLAKVFYRYKRIFLTIRRNAANSRSIEGDECVVRINAIRRLARRFHRPFSPGVLQTVLTRKHSDEDIRHAVESEESPFILVRLINYLNAEQNRSPLRPFTIRNGKLWVEVRKKQPHLDVEGIKRIRRIVFERLSSIIRPDSDLTIRFPKYLDLAAPVSEKMFIGSVPYGSKFQLQLNNYIGIYWRNEWGTHDFDLWIVDQKGMRIGWADEHKKENILFSGDMTNADPEATEIMYCRSVWPDCGVRVVRYNGLKGSRFRLFFGSDDLKELPKNYMVNPDSIRFSEDLVSDSKDMAIGFIADNKVYFSALGVSQNLVPPNMLANHVSIEKAMADNYAAFISLRDVLLAAGYKEFDEHSEGEPDIDLSKELSKDTLIALMSRSVRP